jgi:DNA-directed RNA polymerase beta subunit
MSRSGESFPTRYALTDLLEVLIDPHVLRKKARERLVTYAGKMTAKLSWSVNGGPRHEENRELGLLPIMVKVGGLFIRHMTFKRTPKRFAAVITV